MSKAYDPTTNTVRDARVDDAHLPMAKNFYDFCANVYGPGLQLPWSRQMWILLKAFGEVCPHCTKKRVYNDILSVPVDLDTHAFVKSSNITLLENGICPKCGRHKAAMVLNKEMDDITEVVSVLGQRSGKSTMTSEAVCYLMHKLLKLPKISTVVSGIQEFSPLTGVFTAQSTGQAIRVLWKPIRSVLMGSSWFEEYHDLLNRIKLDTGQELYQINPTGLYIRYFHRNIELYPSGPGKRSLAGDTRIIAGIDELGLFPFDPSGGAATDDENYEEERERANAEEVHNVITNSLATVRQAVLATYKRGISVYPQGLLFNSSSPKSWKDKICRLYAQSVDDPTMLGALLPTWDINPHLPKDCAFIQSKYRQDPARAERDFGANPPKLESEMFDASILSMFTGDNHGRILYEPSPTRTLGKYDNLIEPLEYPPALLSLDAGETDNAFALTVAHKYGHQIKVSLCVEIVPQPGKKIDFAHTYSSVIVPIVKTFNVKFVRTDRWQSSFILDQLLQDFGAGGLEVGKCSLRYDDFVSFKQYVESGQLQLPKMELPVEQVMEVTDYKNELNKFPAAHLYLQFRTVKKYKGNLNKGGGYTDDIFRSLVVGVLALMDQKIALHLSKFVAQKRGNSRRATVLIASKGSYARQLLG